VLASRRARADQTVDQPATNIITFVRLVTHPVNEPTFAYREFARWLANRSSLTGHASEGWRRWWDSKPRLAHIVRDKTEAAYFRRDLFAQRRALMEAWEKFAMQGAAIILSMRA
jgi:hypothetical protein